MLMQFNFDSFQAGRRTGTALAPLVRDAALSGAIVQISILRIDLPHRAFAVALFDAVL